MSNPFRKQGGGAPPQLQIPPIDPVSTSSSSSSTPPPPPPATTFRTSAASPPLHDDLEEAYRPPEDAGRHDNDGGEEGQHGGVRRRSKVVKKVRVLSPPPLSPDTPADDWSYRDAGGALPPPPPPYALSSSAADPFTSEATPTPQEDTGLGLGPPPANPFSKTLEDLENSSSAAKKHEDLIEERREEGAALKAANVARGSLDVDAFKRLLMTGHTGEGQVATSGAAEEAAQNISRDIEATRPAVAPEAAAGDTGGESDSSMTVQFGTRKKAPPPPPSSRHGRSIKTADARGSPDTMGETKPLSPEPVQVATKTEDEGESATVARKPVPAPPPRRGHARMESKAEQALTAKDDEAPPRSSTESALPTRSNSVRQPGAPAPPPPRRPQASHRPVSLQPSPTSATFNLPLASTAHLAHHHPDSMISTPTQEHTAAPLDRPPHSLPPDPPNHVKLSAPPPPPARNTSVRRPPSVHSTEPTSRRTSGETKNRDSTMLPPPPPPARKRGNSRSSVEAAPQRASMDGKRREGAVPGHGDAILADLDALKREVDALRGKLT